MKTIKMNIETMLKRHGRLYKYFHLIKKGDGEVLYSSYDKRDVVWEQKQLMIPSQIVETWVPEPPRPSVYGKPTPLKSLKKGKVFKRKLDSSKAYERGEYDRSYKRFDCNDLDDISRSISLKGSTLVYPWPD